MCALPNPNYTLVIREGTVLTQENYGSDYDEAFKQYMSRFRYYTEGTFWFQDYPLREQHEKV